jgi:outer membrane lipopolysaccharide assembly protein LptE/RlpB
LIDKGHDLRGHADSDQQIYGERQAMQLKITAGLVLAAVLLTTGCGKQAEPEGVIPQGYEDALEKAREVEDTLDAAVKEQLPD